jgi:hypothetical protein
METTGAPSSAATSTARESIRTRLLRPSLSSVGKCLRRGSSAKRAPVSTTQARPSSSSSALSVAARALMSGASGSKCTWSSVSATPS